MSCGQLSKSCQQLQNSDFQSQFYFYSTERKTQKLFKWLVVGFGPKGMPGGMCDIVR